MRSNFKVESEYAALCTRGLCDRQGTEAVTLLDVTLSFVHGPSHARYLDRGHCIAHVHVSIPVYWGFGWGRSLLEVDTIQVILRS